MARISLQNDNKIGKAKKKSFFDIEDASEITETVNNDKESVNAEATEISVKKEKRFKRGALIAVFAIGLLLLAAVIISGIDFIVDGELNGMFKPSNKETVYDKYEPDWETDIFTLEDYLEKRPNTMLYSADGGFSKYEVLEKDVPSSSADIRFFYSYFDAIKHGDHEKLNSFFADEYFNENKKFNDFPMQKVYDIQIIKSAGNAELDERYKNEYAYGVYAVSYKIYLNDGLFCAEVDDRHTREEGILVVYDSNGNGKIVQRIDAKNSI